MQLNKLLFKSNIRSATSLFKNQAMFISTVEKIKRREQYFRDLLLTKENLSPEELGNVARVLKKKPMSITEEEIKKFDEQALNLTRELDNQQLRQVMSLYVFTKRSNDHVFSEIQERNKKIAYKNYVPQYEKQGIVEAGYIKLFHLRNKIFEFISNTTGLKLK
jgi:hypothetical protein